jgi:hypothetical protein
MRLRRELGQHGLAIDDLAGLAGVALTLGDAERALEQAAEILAWIEVNGSAGIEYPLQVYLTCYRTLQVTAGGDPTVVARAHSLLADAHKLLMERAADISDEALRRKFLANVKTNREILSVWEAELYEV